MSKVIEVNDSNWESEVCQASTPVLVEFWAPWCAPCKMIRPIVENLASENDEHIKIAGLNVDENQEISAKHGVRGIPTLILFKDGNEFKRLVGAQGKDRIQDLINQALE